MTDANADVVVVGAGLSGLALATSLAERGVRTRVIEASPGVGGNLRSKRVETAEGAWLLDLGPNSFGENSAAFVDLARRAGIADRIVRAPQSADRRFVWRAGHLREVPSNPLGFLFSNVLPLGGRIRVVREVWTPPRRIGAEESLAQFCDRRLGRAAREKLLTPVVGGIYAGDPSELGAESAFPAMVALEREHGSLIRAAMRGKGPPSRGRLCSFADGLAELPAALRRRLGDALTVGVAARRVVRADGRWRVETSDGRSFDATRLVLATPADAAARLLAPIDAALARELAAIVYAPMTVVHVGARRDALPRLPSGFGFLVPRDEGLRILGAICSSELFPGRAPQGHTLLTVFTGGRLDPDAMSLDDAALRRCVVADLARAVGLVGEPALFHVTRWPRAIPQYVVGHKDRVARVDVAVRALPGLTLLSNWRGGIAMPDCVRNANSAADELACAAPSV